MIIEKLKHSSLLFNYEFRSYQSELMICNPVSNLKSNFAEQTFELDI